MFDQLSRANVDSQRYREGSGDPTSLRPFSQDEIQLHQGQGRTKGVIQGSAPWDLKNTRFSYFR